LEENQSRFSKRASQSASAAYELRNIFSKRIRVRRLIHVIPYRGWAIEECVKKPLRMLKTCKSEETPVKPETLTEFGVYYQLLLAYTWMRYGW